MLDVEQIAGIFLGLVVVYKLVRWKNQRYTPGADMHVMESISASMLLSEVEPEKFAQVNIVTVIHFTERLRFVDFRDRFVENVIMTDIDSRFLYRMDCISSGSVPVWRKAPGWHPFDNCKYVSSLSDVESLVSARLTVPLNIAFPPWELVFVETLGEAANSCAMLTMHHSMGDGFTLCHQLVRRCASADSRLTMHQCYPFGVPRGCAYKSPYLAKIGFLWKFLKAVIKLLSQTPDPIGPIRNATTRKLSDKQICAMTKLPQSVEDLKKIAHKRPKITLNDVIVAACSLGLGSFGINHDATCAIWVGLNRKSALERPKLKKNDWGNANLGTCYLSLPTGCTDPQTVLSTVHSRLAALKSDPEPLVANLLLTLLGSLPLWWVRPFRHLLMDKMSTSISNFPGPIFPIKLPVHPHTPTDQPGIGTVEQVYFLVAPPFSYGPYITLMSYCGNV